MDIPVEKIISNLIPQQFPTFYQEEGPAFIAFVKAYYAWMEETGNTLYHSRRMRDYTDIDLTPEAFLEHFQRKYLYGIPFEVIINKRYLLKHVLDAYRSKSSELCFKLLFRLIYNQDMDLYLPGRDMLRWSDGTWYVPTYLEIADPYKIGASLVGTTIVGKSSGAMGVVESYVTEAINQNLISSLYVTNILPTGGAFVVGEKIILLTDLNSETEDDILLTAPVVLGSMNSVNIINGGQDFTVGDVLGIAHRDLDTNEIISFGIAGKVKVVTTTRGQGQLNFDIVKAGSGYSNAAQSFIYNNPADTTGQGASFDVGQISYVQEVQYNTDLLGDYENVAMDAVSYGFPGNTSANSSTPMDQALTYTNGYFGQIATLTNITTGNNYTTPPNIFVRDTFLSKAKAGNVTYTTTSNVVTGVGTSFDTIFQANTCVALQANAGNPATREYCMVKTVTNATSMILYGPPTLNSTANASFFLAQPIFPANFATYDSAMTTPDGSIPGLNAVVSGNPSSGNDVIGTVKSIDSGKGYIPDELVTMYLADVIQIDQIRSPGTGYANGDAIYFNGGDPAKPATGYVTTDANGSILTATPTYPGCGYQSVPSTSFRTLSGNGAVLDLSVKQYSSDITVTGRVVKGGIGKGRGRWLSNDGFLNDTKYIQDSYYYQDFSYELRAASQLDKYKNILYETFHIAGTEMFGEFLLKNKDSMPIQVAYSSITPIYL